MVVTDYISDVHGNYKSQLPKERKVMLVTSQCGEGRRCSYKPENKGTERVSPPCNVSARSSGLGEAKEIKNFDHIDQIQTLS